MCLKHILHPQGIPQSVSGAVIWKFGVIDLNPKLTTDDIRTWAMYVFIQNSKLLFQ